MNKLTYFFVEDDKGLILGCIKGDRSAQNMLYKKYSKKMLVVCFRYSRSQEDAEDTLIEGFMKVFTNIASYKYLGSFEGWIKRIMINTALEKLKKKSVLYKVINLDDVSDKNRVSDQDVLSEINAKELISLIHQLPPIYQMVFNLYAFEGLKHKEIAEKLGISEGTSKSNLHDSRKWLQKELEKLYYEKKAVNE